MKNILKQLQKYYSSKKILLNFSKENNLTQYFKKELALSTEEANIFGFVLFWYIKDGSFVEIKDICDDLNISTEQYLKIMDIISSIEKKGYFIIEGKRYKSRILNPSIEIDEIIFKKLVYGEDLLGECDFSNFYSIIDTINKLVSLKEDDKISLKYFKQSISKIFSSVDKKLSLYEIITRYSINECILFFYVLVKILTSWNEEIEIGDFTDFIEMRLKDKMELMDKIISNDLKIFKDGVLEIVKDDKTFLTSAVEISVKVSHRTMSKLLSRGKQKEFNIKSNLLKYISYEKIKDEKILFFKEEFEKELNKIKNFLLPERFKQVKVELKSRGLSHGAVLLFYGAPGTGKTATAYEISRITHRDILQVDFSQVQSMWVGESEKNMKKIFDEYRVALENMEKEPILLFNEADSLISRRVNVRDSVDQMSNTLQNILLEELENFNGIFIATTNLIENIDPAFDRRFVYKLKFEMPDREIRQKIWKSKLPELDNEKIEILSEYNLSGGQIDNIVKKYLINKILESKEIDLKEMLRYIQEELEFRKSDKKIIGFLQRG